MSAVDLLARNPDPTEAEVRDWLEGNLCRCTGYHNIVTAVLTARADDAGGAPGACPWLTPTPRASSAAHPPHRGPALHHRPRPLHRRHDPAGQTAHAAIVRSPSRTPGSARSTPRRRAGRAGRGRRATPAPTSRPTRSAASPAAGWSRTRTAVAHGRAAAPGAAHERVRHVGDQVAVVIAETRDAGPRRGRARSRSTTRRCRPSPTSRDALAPGAPQVLGQARATSASTGTSASQAATEAAFARAHHVVKLDLRNNRLIAQRDGAARGIGDFDAVDRREHAEHHEPEPAPDPPAARRVRARHPRAQAAGGRARRRRRLRLEDLPLRRGGDRAVGGAQARPAGQVDGGAHRVVPVRRARPRPRHPRRAGARPRTATSSGLRVDTIANMGAYLSTFAPAVPTYLYGTLLAGSYKTPAIYVEVKAVFTNTVPVDAYRGAGRPEATYVLERHRRQARARSWASTRPSSADATSSRSARSRTRRRWR